MNNFTGTISIQIFAYNHQHRKIKNLLRTAHSRECISNYPTSKSSSIRGSKTYEAVNCPKTSRKRQNPSVYLTKLASRPWNVRDKRCTPPLSFCVYNRLPKKKSWSETFLTFLSRGLLLIQMRKKKEGRKEGRKILKWKEKQFSVV